MTKELLYNVVFWIVIVGVGGWLIWELVPDGWKKFWSYARSERRSK